MAPDRVTPTPRKDWLRRAGVDDIRGIAFHPTWPPPTQSPGRRAADAKATEVAQGFLSPTESGLLAR